MAVVNESDADMVLAEGETVEATLSSSTEVALTELARSGQVPKEEHCLDQKFRCLL